MVFVETTWKRASQGSVHPKKHAHGRPGEGNRAQSGTQPLIRHQHLLAVFPPCGPMLHVPIRKRVFETHIPPRLFRFQPFVPQNFFTLGLELTVESRVRQRESRAGTTHISGSIWLHRSTSRPQQVAVRNILVSPSQLVSGQLVTGLAPPPGRRPQSLPRPRMPATPLLTALLRTP